MKYVVSFFVILLTTFYINIAKSESLIVYINMEMIMNETNAGKSINQKIEEIHRINLINELIENTINGAIDRAIKPWYLWRNYMCQKRNDEKYVQRKI